MLVAKLLMNLASGVVYGAKEPHMAAANPFIAENKGAMHMLYHELEVSLSVAQCAACVGLRVVCLPSCMPVADALRGCTLLCCCT